LARKLNPISGFTRTCPVAAENTEENFIAEKMTFSFQGRVAIRDIVEETKSALLMSNIFRILFPEIVQIGSFFDSVIQESTGWRFETRCI